MKYENLAIVTKFAGDFKVLAFVSGNSRAEIIRNVKNKHRLNVRMQGLIWIDNEDFPHAINSNKL